MLGGLNNSQIVVLHKLLHKMDSDNIHYQFRKMVNTQTKIGKSGGLKFNWTMKFRGLKFQKLHTWTKSITVYSKFALKARESTRKLELFKNQI